MTVTPSWRLRLSDRRLIPSEGGLAPPVDCARWLYNPLNRATLGRDELVDDKFLKSKIVPRNYLLYSCTNCRRKDARSTRPFKDR